MDFWGRRVAWIIRSIGLTKWNSQSKQDELTEVHYPFVGANVQPHFTSAWPCSPNGPYAIVIIFRGIYKEIEQLAWESKNPTKSLSAKPIFFAELRRHPAYVLEPLG
jgi:hypothetical protein